MSHKMSLPPRRRVVAATARRPQAELRAVHVIFEPDEELEGHMCARAEADVFLEGIAQTLASGGVSAIEDDAEDEYLDEVIEREWRTLRSILKTVGVPTEELPLDAEREWIEWRT